MTKTLKIISYNLWFENTLMSDRLKSFAQIINVYSPDIVCLQEVTPEMMVILIKLLNNQYHFSKKEILQSYDVIILSKIKISKAYTIPYPDTDMKRSLHGIVINIDFMTKETESGSEYITIEKRDIFIVTTHNESVFGKNLKNKISQYKFAESTLNKISEDYNYVFFTGDTNICRESEKYFFQNNKTWFDSWVLSGSDMEKCYTFDTTTNSHAKNNNSRTIRERLDRIIYLSRDTNIVCTKFDLIRSPDTLEPSDHYGVMSSFDLS